MSLPLYEGTTVISVLFFRLAALLWLALSISCIGAENRRALAPLDADHLIPVDGEIDRGYQKILEQKLFVTPANYGRIMLVFGGSEGEEAISIYSNSHSKTGVLVTFTKAKQNLGDATWKFSPNRKTERQIVVDRVDVPIPQSTAITLSNAIQEMLYRTRQRHMTGRAEDIVVDGRSLEFSIRDKANKRIQGLLPPDGKGRHLENLRQLTDLLVQYCRASPNRQIEIAKQAEAKANRLVTEIKTKEAKGR